jgi:predicted transcriptional regulator of viral defense system
MALTIVKPIMSVDEKALRIFRNRKNGILRTSQAIKLGIHPSVLYRLRDQEKLTLLTEGFYRLTELPDLQEPDLVTVVLRAPKAVVCLISALSIHGITTQIPHEVHIALPRGVKPPQLGFPPIHAYHFSSATYKEGIEIKIFDGVEVKVYDPAKTLVDCFRFENAIGLDVAIEALKMARTERKCKPNQIMKYARTAKIQDKIRPFIQQEFS